jgi:hypothetical protein
MPEKTARWVTMSDWIPNDDSGGSDCVRSMSRARPINPVEQSDSRASVFGFGGCRTASRGSRSAVHHSWGVRV